MADYSFSSLTTVQPSGLSTGFQSTNVTTLTLNPLFLNNSLLGANYSIVGLTAQQRGWNAPGRPQTGQMYPRGVYNK